MAHDQIARFHSDVSSYDHLTVEVGLDPDTKRAGQIRLWLKSESYPSEINSSSFDCDTARDIARYILRRCDELEGKRNGQEQTT